ncbi:MAG: orotidine-5'-phosphate decarboxylase [Lachnospiraceae bacterium]|jgi:orotidine-5'-phosphate decarboxylase|nr:orotidine-5'-phosphate decarboxylase [Lachnospiraceae bacterium]MEE3461279.1 orotidine-5'-phosphate decarboxylase [Lachnospiraceae bacterium]
MIQKLIEKIREKNAPVVVGLDPKLSYIPEETVGKCTDLYGPTLKACAHAIWEFNKEIIDNIYDIVPAVKPQIAMYEQFGADGLTVFKKTVDYCHEKGLIVIGDVKRGDIGSTSEAYAVGHLGTVSIGGKKIAPFDEDMATVNPYLGTDGVRPFVDVCKANDKGIFVLVKTSNPSSGEFQDRLIDGKPLYEHVAGKVNEWGADTMEGNYSNVGCVIGATYPEMGARLRTLMPHAFILVPGYGAQGGTAKDIVSYFNEDKTGAIVNSSRGIICAYTKPQYASFNGSVGKAARQAAYDMIADINGALNN